MVTPAGNYRLYDYQALSTSEVDQIDIFSGFPENIKLSKLIDRSRTVGHVGSAKLVVSAQPVTTNTVTIGSDVYEFVTASGSVASDTNIAVEIGSTAALTRANFIAAINGSNTENEHGNITLTDEETPALANGTNYLYADEVSTSVRIRNADAVGGNVVVGTQSLALSETITDAADVWNQANLSATGRATSPVIAHGTVTIAAANLATDFNIELPFTPLMVYWEAYDSTYTKKVTTAILTVSGNSILVNANAGGTPLIATDIIQWQAIGGV